MPAGSVATLAHEDPGLEVAGVGGRISTVDMGNQEVMEGAKVEGKNYDMNFKLRHFQGWIIWELIWREGWKGQGWFQVARN